MQKRQIKIDADKVKFWQAHIVRQADSGVSIAEYCKLSGITDKRFYYWQRRLREGRTARKSPAAAAVLQSKKEPVFVPVHVGPDYETPWSERSQVSSSKLPSAKFKLPIEIFCPQGFVVRVPSDAGSDIISGIVQAIARLTC